MVIVFLINVLVADARINNSCIDDHGIDNVLDDRAYIGDAYGGYDRLSDRSFVRRDC